MVIAIAGLPELPLNENGKVDRGKVIQFFERLANPAHEDLEEPKGDLEGQVASVWSELLGIERVSRNQTFFSLGGDSLTATHLVEIIRQRMSVEVPLRRLFASPTVAGLASLITEKRAQIESALIEGGVI